MVALLELLERKDILLYHQMVIQILMDLPWGLFLPLEVIQKVGLLPLEALQP